MKLFKKGDIIVIASVLAAVLIFFFIKNGNTEKAVAEISVDGKIVQTVDLTAVKDKIEIRPNEDFDILIVAENGSIRFEHSECEDKLCVNSGKLKNSGDVAVCLPAKTVITVTGSEFDAVVY